MEQNIRQQIEDGFEKMAQATIKECSKHDCRLQIMMAAGLNEFQKSLLSSKVLSDATADNEDELKTIINDIRNKVEVKYISKI